ncbi:DUF4330 domain-containing protein [Haloarchaeobius sp. FL176]|uniref:DUF4330 domain-containing protein n=1 Tax=Haloarchaeobius sp. FL176 TaxID=2967129 RepID=UPI002148B1FD|nr:DUF4330 domain-containing protein [Haloarchaeobius sp. FL176]
MELIDDNGYLFGVVNVVDALVVLLVLAVVATGAVFVLSDDPEPEPTTETHYATLDLGTQPTYVATLIEEGDNVTPSETEELTVTDVYVTDQGDNRRVLVRVALEGNPTEDPADDTLTYDGGPPRVGRELAITTSEYSTSGRITEVSASDPDLDLQNTRILLETTVTAEEADRIDTDDTITRNNRTIATVESFRLYETDDPNQRRAVVVANLLAHQDGDTLRFGVTPLRVGQTVQLTTGEFDLQGTLLRTGVSGLPVSETDVLLRTELDSDTLAQLEPGDEYLVNDQTVATIQTIDAYGTGASDRRLAYIGVTYQTYQPREVPQFAGQRVREGTQLPFRTEEYEFQGRVVRENALEQRGTETTRMVTLEMENVEPDVANSVEAGMTEQIAGETVVDVTNVEVEPADIVLTSDDGNVFLRDHPVNKDVTVTAELQVRESATGITFKGSSLRQGETVLLDFGTVIIRATVVSV